VVTHDWSRGNDHKVKETEIPCEYMKILFYIEGDFTVMLMSQICNKIFKSN